MEGRSPAEQPAPPRPGIVGRVGGRFKEWVTASPANLGSALLVAALVGSLPFGGWRAASGDEVAQVAVGQPVEADPFRITVQEARYGEDLGGALRQNYTEGLQHVIVIVTLHNVSDATLRTSELRDTITIEGLPDPVDLLGDPVEEQHRWVNEVFEMVDDQPDVLAAYGPGMDYTLAFSQRTSATPEEMPETLTVTLDRRTYKQRTISKEFAWQDPAPVAEVTVPLVLVPPPADDTLGEGGRR